MSSKGWHDWRSSDFLKRFLRKYIMIGKMTPRGNPTRSHLYLPSEPNSRGAPIVPQKIKLE
jgi:hypothetical protein